jgi:hypothetical protein
MFGQDRQKLRQIYHNVWLKMQSEQPLTALERNIAQIISMHPEYHKILDQPERIEQDFFVESGETNPYLHMGLHIALHEQISTDRPAGIRQLYQQLLKQYGDTHRCEHEMMECLTESLWQAQRAQQAPSESAYLSALQSLLDSADKP